MISKPAEIKAICENLKLIAQRHGGRISKDPCRRYNYLPYNLQDKAE